MKTRTWGWGMTGVAVVILTGAAVWASATGEPRKDYIIMEVESLPGDQIKIHVLKSGQKQKVLEVTVGVTDKEVRVVDKDQPGVTTTLFKDKDDDEAGGGGRLTIAKWLDGSGTVPSSEVRHDEHH